MAAEPLQVVVLAAGRQMNLLPAWGIAAITNLVCSILLARHIGAMGVAWGTLIGAVAGLVAQLVITLPKTTEIALRTRTYVKAMMVEPLIASIPAMVLFLLLWQLHWSVIASVVVTALGVPITVGLLWKRTFSTGEQAQILHAAKQKLRIR